MKNLRNVLFVPHGAPTFALNPGAAGAAMTDVASRLKTPRAIIVISPHWETHVPTVGTATSLDTIHDFYGFPNALYALKYPATGCPEGAQDVVTALKAQFPQVDVDATRGLDHGAWVPLLQMFPNADVPIIPVSVQGHAGPAHAYKVGQALATLAERDFLVIASGNLTHNLGDYRIVASQHGQSPAYVQTFSDWLEKHMIDRDVDALLHYRQHAPDGVRAHPTEEHLLPLFVALGAAGPAAQPQPFYRGISDYVLAMDGYAFV